MSWSKTSNFISHFSPSNYSLTDIVKIENNKAENSLEKQEFVWASVLNGQAGGDTISGE